MYDNKYFELTSASLAYVETDKNQNYWNDFKPKYFIDGIKYFKQDNEVYYIGSLFTYNREGRKIYLNTMEDEKGIRENINPVRLVIHTNNTLSIIAGYNKDDPEDFLGELIYDIGRHSICNHNASSKEKRYRVINSYRFIEVRNV